MPIKPVDDKSGQEARRKALAAAAAALGLSIGLGLESLVWAEPASAASAPPYKVQQGKLQSQGLQQGKIKQHKDLQQGKIKQHKDLQQGKIRMPAR